MQMFLSQENLDVYVGKSIEVLRVGGVVLYPTDTLYALGADAFSDEAVAKVFAIKGRGKRKSISAVFSDMAMVERYAKVNDAAKRLAEKFLPGPLTLVLKKKAGIKTGIARDRGTIGIRIPNHPFCLALAKEFGKPITATSANISGEETKNSVDEILKQLGSAAEHIDLAIDAGELPPSLPSTVVDCSGAEPKILREGVLSKQQIADAIAPWDGEI